MEVIFLSFIINSKSDMECSQEFQPISFCEASEQEYGRPKKQQKYVSGENNGKWSQIQHTKYIAFIEHNKDKMRSKEKHRVSKFYKEMSKFVKTRNAFQCRSHHQKLEDRHYFPNKIIAHFKKHNDLTLFEQYKLQLQDLEPKTTLSDTHNVKLQEQNVEFACQTQITSKEPTKPVLVFQQSTPNTPVLEEAVSGSLNTNGYVSWQTLQGNPFWNSFYIYPFYSVS